MWSCLVGMNISRMSFMSILGWFIGETCCKGWDIEVMVINDTYLSYWKQLFNISVPCDRMGAPVSPVSLLHHVWHDMASLLSLKWNYHSIMDSRFHLMLYEMFYCFYFFGLKYFWPLPSLDALLIIQLGLQRKCRILCLSLESQWFLSC